jgi:hypothetical protein
MSYTDDWRWPTEQKYLEELDWEIKERWEYLKQYEKKPVFSDTSSSKIEMDHGTKLAKYRHQLAILTEQEKPQSTEQEESKVRYWEAKLHQHGPEDSSGSQLRIQLQQIEDKFLRAQDEYHKAKARVALQLEANTLHFLKTRDFYESNLNRAKEALEGIRTFKSKPRIKLEMEMKPHQDYIETANKDREEREEWKALKAKILPEMNAWLKKERDAYWQEKDEQERDRQYREMVVKRKEAAALLPEAEQEEHYKKYPEDRPYVPVIRPIVAGAKVKVRAKKVVKQTEEEQRTAICRDVLYGIIEQVMLLGTQSVSSGPEGYSSVAASPCATKGHVVQDPQ